MRKKSINKKTLKIAVLGSSGMLGGTVASYLQKNSNFDVVSFARSKKKINSLNFIQIDDAYDLNLDSSFDYVINCIGIIKPHIDDKKKIDIENAIKINSLFPFYLDKMAEKFNFKVIQIATDCVFSGNIGRYNETFLHDALDVYGKSKSLGEVVSSNFMHLRCSIIGPEFGSNLSLLEWFRTQDKNASITGFTNHFWNGITTLQFAKFCLVLISHNIFKHGSYHIVPKDIITKYGMLKIIQSHTNRKDITINSGTSKNTVDRTLETINQSFNVDLWTLSEAKVLTISEMIEEALDYKI